MALWAELGAHSHPPIYECEQGPLGGRWRGCPESAWVPATVVAGVKEPPLGVRVDALRPPAPGAGRRGNVLHSPAHGPHHPWDRTQSQPEPAYGAPSSGPPSGPHLHPHVCKCPPPVPASLLPSGPSPAPVCRSSQTTRHHDRQITKLSALLPCSTTPPPAPGPHPSVLCPWGPPSSRPPHCTCSSPAQGPLCQLARPALPPPGMSGVPFGESRSPHWPSELPGALGAVDQSSCSWSPLALPLVSPSKAWSPPGWKFCLST